MNEARALLLTDVVDSTKLSEELGDRAMAEVWSAHDRMARDLLPIWRGREIDKTDGMLLLFGSASDALNYARDYHRGLAGLPVVLVARAGLHVGPVGLRENSAADVARGAKPLEVDGLAKPTVARVMSLAQAGQTLLSDDARRALDDVQRPLISHGHWMLKGIGEPIELFEVALQDAAFTAPVDAEKGYRVVLVGEQWRPARQIPTNLPQQLTSFVGRERECREVRTALGSSRLVTLLGMGGMGKTRLAQQVAVDELPHFPDGVWFVDLSPIRDPARVVGQAAQTLDVLEESTRSLLNSLCASLKTKRTLLILDNCEHLIQAAAELAHHILRTTPHVCILATSREPLRVPGEYSYQVLPLPVPQHHDAFESLSRSVAVRLFVQRAQLHKPAFLLTEREAPAIAELVARLEGVPLALELAAARVRAMSVADINERLKDRYLALTGGGRVLLERQQTLRALVDWSYDLLDKCERTVLNRLAVFVGGFDMAAARQVCGVEPMEPTAVDDLVTSLVEKSLAMTDEREQGMRYRMLDTIRDYAHEKLVLAGEVTSTTARHCQHYFGFSKVVSRGMEGPAMPVWVQRMEADLDNVRAGISCALDGGVDPIIAVKYAVALQPFWMMRGYATEGRATIRAALDLPAVRDSEMALGHALYVGAALAQSQSDHTDALAMLEQCLTLRRLLGNPLDIAGTLSTLAAARLATGEVEIARDGEVEALAIFRERGFRVGEAIVLLHLALISTWVGDDARACEYLDECRELSSRLGNREVEAECELVRGEMAIDSGAHHRARELFERSLTISQDAADRRGQANALWRLAKIDLIDGALESAGTRLGAALRVFRAFDMRIELLGCLEDYANLLHAHGHSDVAVSLWAAVTAACRGLNAVRAPRKELRRVEQLESLRRAMTTTAFDQAWQDGENWSVDQALHVALLRQGDPGMPS